MRGWVGQQDGGGASGRHSGRQRPAFEQKPRVSQGWAGSVPDNRQTRKGQGLGAEMTFPATMGWDGTASLSQVWHRAVQEMTRNMCAGPSIWSREQTAPRPSTRRLPTLRRHDTASGPPHSRLETGLEENSHNAPSTGFTGLPSGGSGPEAVAAGAFPRRVRDRQRGLPRHGTRPLRNGALPASGVLRGSSSWHGNLLLPAMEKLVKAGISLHTSPAKPRPVPVANACIVD